MQLVTVKKLSILRKKIKVNVYNKFSENILIYTVYNLWAMISNYIYRYYEQPINYFKMVAGSIVVKKCFTKSLL